MAKVACHGTIPTLQSEAKKKHELSTLATMKLSSYESRYEGAFCSKMEIKYEKNGRLLRSLNDHNEMTLNEFNNRRKENGASKILEKNPEWF